MYDFFCLAFCVKLSQNVYCFCHHIRSVVLSLITALRKLCNHPALLLQPADDAGPAPAELASVPGSAALPSVQALLRGALGYSQSAPDKLRLPEQARTAGELSEHSGKLACLQLLLESFARSGDKAVVVSNFRETLNVIQCLCDRLGVATLRLDGTTPAGDRQPLVDQFNAAYNTSKTVFLLSAKAGGVGINLIGASKLVSERGCRRIIEGIAVQG
jgi:DNA repair and recombination protein RAD54B